MTTATKFSAADTRAELEQAFRDVDRDEAAAAFGGPDPLTVGVDSAVGFALDQYEDQSVLTRSEVMELSAVAGLAAVRAARESIITTVSAWLAGKEGVR